MTSAPKTVAVTGASGFVGRYVIRELLTRGHTVRALVRDAVRAREGLGDVAAKVNLIVGDVCDDAVLAQLVRGADACIHLVGIIREVRGETTDKPQTFERMHVAATRHVVDACRAAGIRRFLQMSALGVGSDGKAEYQKTKWEAEKYVRRSFGDGTDLDWTIFRPALIHGPDGEFVQMMADICSGDVPPYFFLPYFVRSEMDQSVPAGHIDFVTPSVQPVAVQDVAFAFAEALERSESIGEIYNLVGSERLTWPEMLEYFRDTIPGGNKNLHPFFVPSDHAAILATGAKFLGLGGLLPFDAGQAIMGGQEAVADPTKARAHLGLNPQGFRQTVREYAALV